MSPPGPSSHPLPHPDASSSDAERIAELRHTTNFRSVTRNDPAVKAILATSVYSVFYQYDEQTAAWEKQKQEGPLFIVKRDKAPEYALFMLNRQAVKNVSIPLVPGEMKCSVVDASTLQVARRGEFRRGVWFSEGQQVVEHFQQTILEICGEPSKKPDSSSPAITAPPPAPAPAPSQGPQGQTGADGLSRLFAGLVTSQSPSPSPDPSTYRSSPAPAPASVQPYIAPPQPVAPIPGQIDSPHPPGQTVDDLLNSILGIPSSASAPAPAVTKPIPGRVGDASFAQIASPPSQQPPIPQPSPGVPGVPGAPGVPGPRQPAPNGLPGSLFAPPLPPTSQPIGGNPLFIRDGVVSAVDARVQSGQLAPPQQLDEAGKRRFTQDLLHLIHTDPAFVNSVWNGYLASARKRGA